jgi:CBS domain-containing protein
MVEQTDDRLRGDEFEFFAPPTQAMVCPVCGFENIMGSDECANCGSDLRTSDIPQAATEFERLLTQVPLQTVSARAPFTVDADDPVPTVLATMRDNRTADVLVLDDGRLVGVFTERDALLKLATGERLADLGSLGGVRVREVMTADPVVLRADDSVAVAVQKMAVGGFRHIPLVEDGHPIGVISAIDIFRHVLRIVD